MNLFLIISLVVLVVGIVLLASYFRMFRWLRHKLKDADYNTYVTLLGRHHQFRPVDTKTLRYKWTKGIFTIKATFDSEGKPIGNASITRRTLTHSKKV
ncbi:MAG: hypothetical protein QM802_18370 [Agriterribacter sp.]